MADGEVETWGKTEELGPGCRYYRELEIRYEEDGTLTVTQEQMTRFLVEAGYDLVREDDDDDEEEDEEEAG